MAERVSSAFFLFFCAGYAYLSTGYSFGTMTSPQSGFLPIIVGIIGTVLAAINLFNVLKAKPKTAEGSPPAIDWLRILLFSVGLLVYILILRPLGYFMSTFLALLYLLKVAGVNGWMIPTVVAGIVAGGFYILFVKLFGITFT